MIVKVVDGNVVQWRNPVVVGVEADNLVTDLVFVGVPDLSADQLVTLHWATTSGTPEAGNIIELTKVDNGWKYQVTEDLTQYAGREISAFLRVTSGSPRWSSQSFSIQMYELPTIPDSVILPEPTVIDQMLAAIQADKADRSNTIQTISEFTSAAQLASSQAVEAQENVASDKTEVMSTKTAVEAALTDAQAAKEGAKESEDAAAASAASALASKNAAKTSEDNVTSNTQKVASDKIATSGYKEAAEAAATTAISAKNTAVAAKDQVVSDAAIVTTNKDLTAGYMGRAENAAIKSEDEADKAELQAEIAQNNILNGVSNHNQNSAAHQDVRADIIRVEALARGRATSYTFETRAQLDLWLAGLYARADGVTKADLIAGDNLYIQALNEKDQWWTGTEISPLEAEAPDLRDYYLKTQIDAMMPIVLSQAEYQALSDAGLVQADRRYDVYT